MDEPTDKSPDVDDQLRADLESLIRAFLMFREYADSDIAAAILTLTATLSFGFDPLKTLVRNPE